MLIHDPRRPGKTTALAAEAARKGGPALAATCLFWLNHYAKRHHTHRAAIYSLKTRLIATLYQQGYCIGVVLDPPTRSDRDDLYCFSFLIGDALFVWHQPVPLVTFDVVRVDPPPAAGLLCEFRELTASERDWCMHVVRSWLIQEGG